MTESKTVFLLQENILRKLPEEVRFKVAIAGGAVRDTLLGVEVKDYDLFVEDLATETALMAFLEEKGKIINVNSQLANYTYEDKWIQVIRGKYWKVDSAAIISDFDFVHCCAMVTLDPNEPFKCHSDFYKCLATKSIQVNVIKYPLSSLERLQKYIQKGYTACNGTFLTLAKAINDMDKSIFETIINDPLASVNLQQNELMFYADGSPRFMGID